MLLRVAEETSWLALADSDASLWARGVAWRSRLDVGSTSLTSTLQVQGREPRTATDLFGEEALPDRYYWCTEASLEGIPVVISRTGWTGEIETGSTPDPPGDDL